MMFFMVPWNPLTNTHSHTHPYDFLAFFVVRAVFLLCVVFDVYRYCTVCAIKHTAEKINVESDEEYFELFAFV